MKYELSHRAEFMRVLTTEKDAAAFIGGYLAASVTEDLLCRTLQAWRRHLAELDDLEHADAGPHVVRVDPDRD